MARVLIPIPSRDFDPIHAEVTRALSSKEAFLDVSPASPYFRLQSSGTKRDTPDDSRPAFVVRDGNYLSARWPGDVFTFGKVFGVMLNERQNS